MCWIRRCAARSSRVLKLILWVWLLPVAVAGLGINGYVGFAAGVAAVSTPTPAGMISITDRLARPTLPANPTQADLGGQVFYYVCMACHGDQGQGLTPEWVASWGLDKNACWASKCHAANHPPEGFVLPKNIPAVVGPVVMNRFSSALELHDFIQTKMPWQAPGRLSGEEYWQLTAFLLRLNGIDPGPLQLDETNAAQIRWRPAEPTITVTPVAGGPTQPPTSTLILVGLGLLALGGVAVIFRFFRLRSL